VETHADELRRKAVLYVNSDTNGRGFLRAGGSHSLQTLVNQVAAGVRDPQTGVSVLERLRARMLVDGFKKGAEEEDRRIARRISASAPVPLQALGSGSDYTPFLQHLGIASLDIRYGGEDHDTGIYHSVYDSFDHYLRFGDPDFAYGVALAKTIGRVMLRAADADVLPMRFSDFADTVGQYLEEVRKLADDLRERTDQQHRLLDAHAFQLAADPTETFVPPERESSVPFFNFAPLDNALLRLKNSARTCDEACARATRPDSKLSGAQRTRLNTLIQGLEQTLIYPQGLPEREWYRHMIYAPGLHTGYGVKTLPGVREAIEQRQWSQVDKFMTVIAAVLDSYSDRLDQTTATMKE
jgi:N-acetylated-alpha-linked acidic dipeptidase